MKSYLVNRLLVWMARKLNIAPILAHVILLILVTLLFLLVDPSGWNALAEPAGFSIWFGIGAIVILVTWLSKGKLRSDWLRAKPWQDQADDRSTET